MRYRISIGYDTAGFFFVVSSNVPGLEARGNHVVDVVKNATAAARRLLRKPCVEIRVDPGIMVRNSSPFS